VHGVDEPNGERKLVRCWSRLERVDRREAAARRAGEPLVGGDCGSCAATRFAFAATIDVIWSEKAVESAFAQNGAQPLGSSIGSAKGSPPFGSETAPSQSHNPAASGALSGAT
jgi:hypothetical protein